MFHSLQCRMIQSKGRAAPGPGEMQVTRLTDRCNLDPIATPLSSFDSNADESRLFVRSSLARRTLAVHRSRGFDVANGDSVQQDATLLDAKTLSKLGSLQLRVRRVVEGVLTGLHRSPHRGQAVEFAEHKEYAAGDELRDIDWRVYARADKYYVKKYEVETNLRCWLVVDASASMAYGRDGLTKIEYAKTLAASLAWLLVRQQDMVGLVVAGSPSTEPAAAESLMPPPPEAQDSKLPSAVRRSVSPRASAGHLSGLIEVLDDTSAHGATDLAGALDYVAEKARRRAVVLVFSDLFDPSPKAIQALARLRGRRCEVGVFHTLDRDELEFPFEDSTEFLSLEGDARVETSPHQVREGYLAEMKEFLETTRRSLVNSDVEYLLAPTNEPPDKVLLTYLARRRGPQRGG